MIETRKMVTRQIQDSEAVSKRFRQDDPSWQAFCARVMVRENGEARQVREAHEQSIPVQLLRVLPFCTHDE